MVNLKMLKRLGIVLLCLLLPLTLTSQELEDDAQSLDERFAEILEQQKRQLRAESQIDETDLKKFSASELVDQARILMQKEQLLSARTRLLAALQKDPKYYPAHNLLAGYYLAHVGHFRLALKYVKQGRRLFEEQNGKPPYRDILLRLEHGQILYLISQIRLNLDNYQGALDALDEYESLGYYSDWYPSSRAWILMKLGRIDEAIKLARMGVMSTSNKGSSLNMLGILLSVDNQPEASLGIFERAIRYERLLGESGRPATPLNNAGEVYRERFRDLLAQSYWDRAKKLPDGCEHVLPSLNLAILMLDQLKDKKAEKSINSFESCVAQYVMRNDEEHRSLVNLARGRIALQRGQISEAKERLAEALERSQWFGKIGTNQNDLKIAASISYAEALEAENNKSALTLSETTFDYMKSWQNYLLNTTRIWWTLRQARFLIQSMDNMEDVDIRHTDSLLEYPKLGWFLKDFPIASLQARLKEIQDEDERELAHNYYDTYRAHNLLHHGKIKEGMELANKVRKRIKEASRETLDAGLLLQLNLMQLENLSPESKRYESLAIRSFEMQTSALRSHGLPLPVNGNQKAVELKDELAQVGFLVTNNNKLPFSIQAANKAGDYILRFESDSPRVKDLSVKGNKKTSILNRFAENVFTGIPKEQKK